MSTRIGILAAAALAVAPLPAPPALAGNGKPAAFMQQAIEGNRRQPRA